VFLWQQSFDFCHKYEVIFIPIYIQDATLHSLFYLETPLRVSGVTSTYHKECKYIPIYIQEDANLHSLFYLETAVHVSGITSTQHQERIQLCLQHLVFVIPFLLSAAIKAGSSNCSFYHTQ
jgi:hypothetical protein